MFRARPRIILIHAARRVLYDCTISIIITLETTDGILRLNKRQPIKIV